MVETNLQTLMLDKDNIENITRILKVGGTILYPTDTVWGIGCDATQEDAVERIYQLKGTDPSEPFTILVSDIQMLKQYISHLHPRIETLLFYHSRPLTIIYENPKNLPQNLLSPDNTAAIRITTDPFCQEIIHRLGKPVVATSANVVDNPFPKSFGEISSQIIKEVDYVVKYRQNDKDFAPPSVMVKYDEKGELIFLRD